MSCNISILLTGSEVMDGRVQDSNAHFIAQTLSERGIPVLRFMGCGDSMTDIKDALTYLTSVSTDIVISGGIGPTTDDLTREAVSAFTDRALVLNPSILEDIKVKFAKRKRVFDPSNTKQALFPEGSSVIPNPNGTAAGFMLPFPTARGERRVYILPGVPSELRTMFTETVLPHLITLHGEIPLRKVGFRVFGLSEAAIGSRVVSAALSDKIEVSYRAAFPEIHVVLKTKDRTIDLTDALEKSVREVGAHYVHSRDIEISHEESVHHALLESGGTLALAESCTGGLLGGKLTEFSGASRYLLGGEVVYGNEAKVTRLGVLPKTIEQFGAVSFETAREMAKGIKEALNARYGVSITGIAGPDGGSDEKPVGTFFVGISSPQETTAYRFFSSGDRKRVRLSATHTALEVLRRTLLSLPIEEFGTK